MNGRPPAAGIRPRVALVDFARGLALAAMAVYHTAWDLQFLRLAPVDATGDFGWKTFAHLIAGSFLALVGVSLVLAARGGLDRAAFMKRLALVGGAALAVTLVTAVAMPQGYIFFGILHCIAVSSVLALPFLRAPIAVVLAAAAAVIALPHVVQAPLFDAAALRWIGLGATPPATSDYVPIFPWFGPTLLGIAGARLALKVQDEAWWARFRPGQAASRGLAWAGRHSLSLYLIHQPILFGTLWTVLQIIGPNAAAETAIFMRSCVPACAETGNEAAGCRAACVCSADALKQENLWRPVMDNQVAEGDRLRLSALAQECHRAKGP